MTMYKNECIRLKRELETLEAKMRTPLPEFKTCSNGTPIYISISGGYTLQLAVTDPSTLELTESILLQLLAGYHNYLEKAKQEDEQKPEITPSDVGGVK
jgi:hypothetical protein